MLINGRSIGIEYEYEDFLHKGLPGNLEGIFHHTDDASCQRDSALLNGGLLVRRPWILPYMNAKIGGELVSEILDSKDEKIIMDVLEDLTDYIIERGESSRSNRAGIHIHVCYVNASLRQLKSIIRLWRHLEDVFYYIGGMGYKFRGEENDSIYCRPLTENGPIIVPTRTSYARSVVIDHLLASGTSAEFWDRWGDVRNQGGAHYFPVRYHGINLSPMINRGSLEFRVFNKTVNPLFLYAIIKLCTGFAELSSKLDYAAFKELKLLQENSIYANRGKEDISRTLIKFCELSEIKISDIETLLQIFDLVPPIRLNNEMVFSHLRNVHNHWVESTYKPETVNPDLVKRPRFADLHRLRGER